MMLLTMVRPRMILHLTNRQSRTDGVGMFPRFCSFSTTDTAIANAESNTWSEHRLNCGRALVKAAEVSQFKDLCQQPTTTLQGIGPKHAAKLQQIGLTTIKGLADYRFFHLAVAIQTLAETEEGERLELAVLNIDKGLSKEYEKQSFQDILKSPVHCLQGISEQKAVDVWKPLGVVTVRDLATWKYFRWAQAIVTAAKFEQTDAPTPTTSP
jgi:nucleotidyltransferase/DNA polymerase involved in DNA repair